MTDPAFHDVRFPLDIALKSSGTLSRKTDIISFGSGQEQRNSRWMASKRRYQVGVGIKTLSHIESLVHFFEARRGPLHGFCFHDPLDHKSSTVDAAPTPNDQTLATGDGQTQTFLLTKTYLSGAQDLKRRIYKPLPDTLRLAINGHNLAPEYYSLSDLGQITLSEPLAEGAALTAGFYFDVPVRFMLDELDIDLDAFGAGAIPDVQLIELIL